MMKRKAYTLIEILIVVVLLGIICSVLLPRFTPPIEKKNEEQPAEVTEVPKLQPDEEIEISEPENDKGKDEEKDEEEKGGEKEK